MTARRYGRSFSVSVGGATTVKAGASLVNQALPIVAESPNVGAKAMPWAGSGRKRSMARDHSTNRTLDVGPRARPADPRQPPG